MTSKLTPPRSKANLSLPTSVFFNPFTDYAFKKLFGEEANKDLLIDFLNSLLPEKHRIADLKFLPGERLPATAEERKAYFDIFCQTERGQQIIVEMQRLRIRFFKDRTIYYGSIPIVRQAKRGKDWNFELTPVYLVAILDYEPEEEDELPVKVKQFVQLRNEDAELFSDKLNFIYVQLHAFKKQEIELQNRLDKWLFFLKNLESFEAIPQILKEKIFKKGFETARLANMNAQQSRRYQISLDNYRTNRAAMETALETGLAKGFAKGHIQGYSQGREEGYSDGRSEGIATGIAEGIAEGIATGIAEGIATGQKSGIEIEKYATVERAFLKKLPPETAAELSELPLKKVKALYKELEIKHGQPASQPKKPSQKKRAK